MLDDKLHDEFVRALKRFCLLDYQDALLAEARECVHFFYTEGGKALRLGASKVGGIPDLPDSIEWPAGSDDDGKPRGHAEFLAQFNLADLPATAQVDLPRKGHLWLFIKNEWSNTSWLPAAVFFRDGTEPLKPRTEPKSLHSKPKYPWDNLQGKPLRFERGISLPWSSCTFDRRFRKIGSQLAQLSAQLTRGLDACGKHSSIDGQIGGFSDQAERDLTYEYAIKELGHPEYVLNYTWESVEQLENQIKRGLPFPRLEPGKQELYRSKLRNRLPGLRWVLEHEQEIRRKAESLQLLCMFSRSCPVFEFGDGMSLDFFIHREDLAKRDFSNVYCALPMLL